MCRVIQVGRVFFVRSATVSAIDQQPPGASTKNSILSEHIFKVSIWLDFRFGGDAELLQL